MTWDEFIWFAIAASFCWITGAVLSFRKGRERSAMAVSLLGSFVFLIFIVGMWMSLERPPLKTQGETRLWYSLFLSLTGIVIFARWKYRWILSFSTIMAIVFACINIFKPEIHSKTLMPALQSPWFIPHVTVYMFSYALMGSATICALYLWWKDSRTGIDEHELTVCDNLVRIGWIFLTIGMVMGALWAKEAWGDFWTWDPKETWALATWLSYLLYLHIRPYVRDKNILFALLIFSFILLQMCWYGVNYLSTAQGSMHTY